MNFRLKHILTIFSLALAFVLTSLSAHADIVIPTFYHHHNERNIRGEQIYSCADVENILWQLNYWSMNLLPPSALSQALNDVPSKNGKDSGKVVRENKSYNLRHASAGKGKESATLFFIVDNGNQRIVGIGSHKLSNVGQGPKYKLISWDERYKIEKTKLEITGP